jgi:hypothetical protein
MRSKETSEFIFPCSLFFSIKPKQVFMRSLTILFLTIILLSSCRHYSQGFEAYFCTSTEADKKSYLYIDHEKIGLLPYVANVPSCDEVRANDRLLYVDLRAGRHLVEVKDIEGNLLFAEKLRAGRSGHSSRISSSTKKRRWASRFKIQESCLVAELMY